MGPVQYIYLVAAGLGVISMILYASRGAWKEVVLSPVAAVCIGVFGWLIVASVDDRGSYAPLLVAALTLTAVVVVPGAVGAVIARSTARLPGVPLRIAIALMVTAALLYFVSTVGLLGICWLDVRCAL